MTPPSIGEEEESVPNRSAVWDPGGPSGNLPVELSSFIGREREVSEVERLVADSRLLTLTGPGGCGKTRLAMAVAFEVVEDFEDGAWWVGLASLSDPQLVPQAVAQVADVREGPSRPLSEALIEHLKSKRMLLVLDNCEHLIGACAALAGALLRACPNLKILATSREALNIGGERAWDVPSLSLPDPGRTPSIEELRGYEAVRLFVERAKSVASTFELTEKNAPAVARLCQRLEGMPLAIELAAARVSALSVEEILKRLEDSLRLLAGRARSAPERQRTLRGTLDWSFELLSEPERELFGRLSVFLGGWTLEAAEAVGAGSGIEEGDVLDLLSRLVDKSLVVAEGGSGGALRYRMLEPVRQYGQERLEEREEAEQVRERHARHFLALAEEAEPELREQEAWLERLEREHPNFRAALSWALARGEAELGLRLGAALGEFWNVRGHLSEGRRWLERGLTASSTPSPERAKALNEAGWIATLQGDERAILLLEESLRIFRELGNKVGVATSLNNLGWAVLRQGDRGRLKGLREEAEALRREPLDPRTIADLLSFLVLAALDESDYGKAVELLEENLALNRELGDMRGIIISLNGLGLLALIRDDHERAAVLLKEDLHLSQELGDKVGIAYSLLGLAGIAAKRGEPACAARLWGAAEALREAIDLSLSSFDHSHYDYEGRLAAARFQLDEAAWEAAWEEGRAMAPEGAIEYALSEEEGQPATLPEEDAAPLSTRELEVLRLVAEGLTDSEVAERLYLSPRTVGQHLRSIYRKLGVPTRAAAAKEAVERNLI